MVIKSITADVENFIPAKNNHNKVAILDANDSFTHNLVQSFLKIGAEVKVIRAHISLKTFEEEIKDCEYLVLSPGPGIPDEAGIMKDIITRYMGKIPIFAVCLGMQAINEVFGGKTIKADKIVHGKTSLIDHDFTGIFTGISSPTKVARYHSLIVSDVSEQLEIQSIYNEVVMAFRNYEYKIAAVQFHPESFMTTYGLKMLQNYLEGNY